MRIPHGAPGTTEIPAQPPGTPCVAPDPQPLTPVDSAQAGIGALQGRQVSVPGLRAMPPPADTHGWFSAMHQWIVQPLAHWAGSGTLPAASVIDLSTLMAPVPGSLSTNPAVLDALQTHAKQAGTQVSREKIQAYVALGERVVRGLQQLCGEGGQPHQVSVEGRTLTANMEVTRAISWYVVACAAQQDVNHEATDSPRTVVGQQVRDLSVAGSYVFRDPRNAIFRFLQSSPLAQARFSSHFNEMSANGQSAYGRVIQLGIEDYERQLPGENGTLLFDQLQDGTSRELMFVKFELAGVPSPLSAHQQDDMGKGAGSAAQAAWRSLMHTMSFLHTRFATPLGVERKEHVYKGLLQPIIYAPFMQLVKQAEEHGWLAPEHSPAHQAKQVRARGLPHVEATLVQLAAKVKEMSAASAQHQDWAERIAALQRTMAAVKAELGAQSADLNIRRRGAETHVNLNPPHAHLQAAHEGFQTLAGEWAVPSDVLQPRILVTGSGPHAIAAGVHLATARDWDVHGVVINDVAYPPGPQNGMWPPTESPVSTLEQACSAFVGACGGNPVAADWISRFAHQGLAAPLMSYLQAESLGSIGAGHRLTGGISRLKVSAQADGVVNVTLDYHFENPRGGRQVQRVATNEVLEMNPDAKLHASVTLCFEGLEAFTSRQAPVPRLGAPLTYTIQGFDVEDWDLLSATEEAS